MEQGQVCDIRLIVRIDENLKAGSELERVLMQKTGSDRVIARQTLGQSRVNGQLFLRLGDIDEA